MKIRDILAEGKPTLSFEVFPPKTQDAFASVEQAAEEIAKLDPAFMSVTYGAGGGTSDYTVKIASELQKTCGVTPLAHLTCVSSTREKVHRVLEELKAHKIENILALRGDIPRTEIHQRCTIMPLNSSARSARREISVLELPAIQRAMWNRPTKRWIWII